VITEKVSINKKKKSNRITGEAPSKRKERNKKMKKIVFMMVAMMSVTLAFAENENASNTLDTEAYNMNVNMRKLAVTLGMTFDQMEAVEDIHRNFCNEMLLAAHAEKGQREELVEKAVKKDERYMGYVLNKEQYRKYLILLNATLRNRGLK